MSGDERTVLFQLPTVISGQLACTQGTVAGRSFPLSAGTFVIGRQEGCDLVLAREPGVSKLHAKIVAESGHYEVVDCESRNGTLLNGRPVQSARLRSGDEIRICDCVLRFTQTGGDLSGLPSVSPPAPEVNAAPASPTPTQPEETAQDDIMRDPGEPPEVVGAPPAHVTSSAVPWFFTGFVASVVGVLGLTFGLSSPTAEAPSATSGEVRVNRVAEPIPTEAVRPMTEADAPVADDVVPRANMNDGEPARTSGDGSDDGVGDTSGSDGPPVEPEPVAANPAPAALEPEDEAARPSATPRDVADAPAPEPRWFDAKVQPAKPVDLKIRSEVTVAQVLGKDGTEVRRGELLLLFEDGDDDEVANLRANIEALEIVAESQPSAAETLEMERGKLRRLLARRGDNKFSAPVSGVLQGFEVQVGSRLATGDKVGQLLPVGTTLRAVIEPQASIRRWKRGARVVLRSQGATYVGKIIAIERKGERLDAEITTTATLEGPVEVALP